MSDVIRFPRSARPTALAVSGLTEAEDGPGNFKMSDLYGRQVKRRLSMMATLRLMPTFPIFSSLAVCLHRSRGGPIKN